VSTEKAKIEDVSDDSVPESKEQCAERRARLAAIADRDARLCWMFFQELDK